jgi:recyclin-1
LLTRAREVSPAIYLQATAASFKESWRMVDVLVEVAGEKKDGQEGDGKALRFGAEDIV